MDRQGAEVPAGEIQRSPVFTDSAHQGSSRPGVRVGVASLRRLFRPLLLFLSVILVLGAWEAAAKLRLIDPLLLGSPSAMVRAAGSVLQKGIGHDFAVSAIEVGLGLGFGAVAGVAIGLVSGLVRVVYFAVDPWLTILYALPIVAIAPLLIVELGIGLTAKIVIVTLFAIFPVVLNTIKGVQVSSRTYLDVARVYRASRRLTLTSVVLPGIAPYVLTGLRLAGGRALVGMVVAEFTAADSGIGHRLQVAGSTLDTGLVMLLIIVVGVAGVLYIRGISEAEARVSRWRLEAQS